jgi:hypothetical protein
MLKEDIPFKNYDHGAKMAAGFHFTIDRDGHWYCHDPAMGVGPIKNERISKLFAGAGSGKYSGKGLSRDAGGLYWLKAPPNDVYGVEVEDVPFVITGFHLGDHLSLTTNFDEAVELTGGKTFFLKADIPYIEVRPGLLARIGRNVFYQLIEKAGLKDGRIGLQAGADWHDLGKADAT